MTLQTYIEIINKRFLTGISREHSYRGDLQTLLQTLAPDVLVTNEPARIKCGAPDYVLTRNNIPIGYIEAKDIGVDLQSKTLKEQFDRYRKSLPNLIFTDYLDFHFYTDGDFVTSIAIAEIVEGKIVPIEKNFAHFTALMHDFVTTVSQSIKSSEKLSQMMANKAKLLATVIGNALESDVEDRQNTSLRQQLAAFEQILIHDITPREFADIYAQTIAYGMFAARLHDDTLDTFTRQEAAQLIPQSNPFLRKMFQYIAGYDLDTRIVWIVDALADIFRATDVAALLQNFGQATQMTDPIIHFYENFLAEYDPKLRKARGVWYTPEPVVNFIVRAVDDVLKTEFGLKKGLADTSKTKIKLKVATHDKRSKTGYTEYEKEIHKVQILDPATGTGTFLAEVVKHIYNKNFKAMQGMWSSYVENDLIPRLNGFELLMASYAMAHLKLDLLLQETGYKAKPTTDLMAQRFKIFLTNSLEPGLNEVPNLFMAQWLTDESAQAAQVKENTAVMVILGNPPYSGESQNKGEWIKDLMDDYKKEPGGKEKLKERNPKMINDDYVKFMRYGQHFIEKNGEGVLAFINPHGFLDNPTFRGMRWNLLKTYDKIYTIDLHGNSKKKETAPDGSADQNVFDIQQGVSINIFIKTGKKKSDALGQVFHYDLYGKRELKYDFLKNNQIKSINFQELKIQKPYFIFKKVNFETREIYEKGFILSDLFDTYGMGITTGEDKKLIAMTFEEIQKRFTNTDFIQTINYRFFDKRQIYYDNKAVERGRKVLMSNMLKENFGLISLKRARKNFSNKVGIVNGIVDKSIISTLDNAYVFPLYLYETENALFTENTRTPNLDPKIVAEIAKGLGLTFTPEKETTAGTFAPIDILDYIYAVLHSPTYRETYKEFLKIDFPRVPFPNSPQTLEKEGLQKRFWKLVKLGGELRQLHLLESDKVEDYITGYPENGDNIVTRKMTTKDLGYAATSDTHGNVWINDNQYFENVPLEAWEFYIGGYQPAQKWLKDRNGRELSFEDILHYQKIIVALTETARIMEEIDSVFVIS